MTSILEEINARNDVLYEKAKIELASIKPQITEIPRYTGKKEIVFMGMSDDGMAIFQFRGCW